MGEYNSSKWRKLRKSVINRDNRRCQECGYRDGGERGSLHAHHIVPRSEGGPDHKENLVSLCSHCHPKIEESRVDPKYISNKSYRVVCDELVVDTILDFVEEEIRNNETFYQKLILENPKICSSCYNYKYEEDRERPFIRNDSRNLHSVVRNLVGERSISSISPTEIDYGDCSECGSIYGDGFRWTPTYDELIEYTCRISKFLKDGGISFDEDILFDCVKHQKTKPEMQNCDDRILETAIEYAIYKTK